MRIYFVEDEKDLSEIIRKYLVKEGFEVTVFGDGETAMKHIKDPVDLWILDIMLPGDINGYDIIKELKAIDSQASIIFTSARDQDLDRFIGLELGSDDYLIKPYSPKELVLRVKAILRRGSNSSVKTISHEGYEVNLSKREIRENDELLELTNKEFELLLLFVSNINVAFDRAEILSKIWGPNYYGSDRVVDDLLRRLRQKLPSLKIETIYGYGYKLL